MAKKKGMSRFKRALIVLGVLGCLQGIFFAYVYWGRQEPLSIRDAIETSVNTKSNLSPYERARRKVQLALNDYKIETGKLPTELGELIPKYFDQIPLDPATRKPFEYKVDGEKYYVGDPGESAGSKVAGAPGELGDKEKADLIASLSEDALQVSFVYDSTGKRDPFFPFDFSPKPTENDGKTQLERYDIGQLKLTAVLTGFSEPTATVENNVGRGFTVKKGTKIGANGGEVIEILPDRILILETSFDFTGEKKTRTIEMKLRTKDLMDF